LEDDATAEEKDLILGEEERRRREKEGKTRSDRI